MRLIFQKKENIAKVKFSVWKNFRILDTKNKKVSLCIVSENSSSDFVSKLGLNFYFGIDIEIPMRKTSVGFALGIHLFFVC
jgi:hypothetical protein